MKKTQYGMSAYLFCHAISCYGLESTNSKTLERQAWEKAFNGENSEAIKLFTNAARGGSLTACKFLAYNYSDEPLIDAKNSDKALFFKEQADIYKRTYPHEHGAEDDLILNIKKLKAVQAGSNSPWYRKCLDAFTQACISLGRYPGPEECALELFRSIRYAAVSDQEGALKKMDLLQEVLVSTPSKESVHAIFKELNDGYQGFYFSDKQEVNYQLSKALMNALEKSARRLDLLEDLKVSYRKLFTELYYDYNKPGRHSKQTLVINFLQELFPSYEAHDKEEAHKALFTFLQVRTKDAQPNIALLPNKATPTDG
jgi:hypothetical protein